MKKLISGLLSVLFLASAIVCAIPLTAGAASSKHTAETTQLSVSEIKAIVQKTSEERYDTAEEALKAEDALGYLVSFTKGGYSVYINVYTGRLYYKNNATGQILTSNPVNMHGMNNNSNAAYESGTISKLMSQIAVTLFDITSNTSYQYNSFTNAAMLGQISVQETKEGYRVNYTIGDTTTRYLYPGMIRYDSFMEYILEPMLNTYRDMLLAYETEIRNVYPNADLDFLDGTTFTAPDGTEYDVYKKSKYQDEDGNWQEYSTIDIDNLKGPYLTAGTMKSYLSIIKTKNTDDYTAANALGKFISKLVSSGYSLENPYEYMEKASLKIILDEMYTNYPITKEGIPVFVAQKTAAKDMRDYSNNIKKYATDFTYSTMFEEEEICGYEYESVTTPVLRCSVEYSLSDKGELLVNVPANSITFDTTTFTLKEFDVLPNFGAGNMTDEDGYAFYPDGSGTIVTFKEFFSDSQKPNIDISSAVFGQDFSYASVTGKHREQVTMPVFGVVNTVSAGETTQNAYPGLTKVTNGYFAILEEGSSLATLRLVSGGSEHRFMNVSTAYTPYPIDTVNLSESIGTGSSTATATTTSSSSNATVSLGNYTITGKVRYNGNYTIRYTMLCDPTIAALTPNVTGATYLSNYSNMAKCYRDYLKADGTLKTIEKVSENLPLYIEVIGAMEIDDTFLTFPIRKKIALTTFDDVLTMYEDFEEKGLSNVNFKMTGFANGGIESTYPVRNKMERVLGGLSAFKKLVKAAKNISEEDGKNLGLYPEYDFQYVNKATLFDGVGYRHTVSRMLDNRYAVKRVYNSVSQSFEMTTSSVIAAEALDKLYTKFQRKFKKTGAEGLSVSTLGSDLSSNLDEKETVDRDTERQNVMNVLDRMANTDNYSLMIDTGNIYAVKYATHILNAETDSSHFRYSSYAVPFVGMVLHSYVNYAGSPLNNSGSPEYEILRDIESGASLYYTLCYEHDNIAYMKKEIATNEYYSVDYDNWFDTIVKNYNELNAQISDLQDYIISEHAVIKGERVVSESEREAFYKILSDEFIGQVKSQLAAAIDEATANLADGEKLDVTVDTDALYSKFYDTMMLSRYETVNDDYELDAAFKAAFIQNFNDEMTALKTKTETDYVGNVQVTFDSVKIGNELLADAFLSLVDEQLAAFITEQEGKLAEDKTLKITVDTDKIFASFETYMKLACYDLSDLSFEGTLKAMAQAKVVGALADLKTTVETAYAGDADAKKTTEVKFDTVTAGKEQLPYASYLTDSSSLDNHNYVETEYTCDNGNIVLVTYYNETTHDTVRFILNYNIFSVVVKYNGKNYNLGKYSYVRINDEGGMV